MLQSRGRHRGASVIWRCDKCGKQNVAKTRKLAELALKYQKERGCKG